MKPLIQISHLSAGYDDRIVLRDVNLTVCEQDFLGIIGPNGSGKTTLIKCMLGLLKPVEGSITFTSCRTQAGSSRPTIGYLPQYSSIDRKFPISVQEVVLSGLSSQKPLTARFSQEQQEKARDVLCRMGLEEVARRPIGSLSGGQLQRVLLGRAIVSDPEVLILDEPNTYIDKHFEARLYELLDEINRRCAIVLVSHDINAVHEHAKKKIALNYEF